MAAPTPAAGTPEKIVALGRIEPRGGVVSIGGMPGARIGSIPVGVGDEVEKGRELIRLDNYEELDANCRLIAAQLDEAKGLVGVEGENADLLAKEAEIERRQIEQLDPLDIAAQKDKIAVLALNVAGARHDLETLTRLKQGGVSSVADQQIEGQRLLARRAEAERDAAGATLEKMTVAHEIGKQKFLLQREKITIGRKKSELIARVRSLEQTLKVAELQRERARIKAPAAGVILKVAGRPGEIIGNLPVIQMGDLDHMYVVAEVSERSIDDLPRGGSVEVDGPGRLKLAGQVDAGAGSWMVGKNTIVGVNPALEADSRIVEVRVRLDEESSRLARKKSNLQVTVTINPEPAPPRYSAGAAPAPTPRPGS